MMARQVSRPARQRQLCRRLAQGVHNCRRVQFCPYSEGQHHCQTQCQQSQEQLLQSFMKSTTL